jgi:hypothetical protein
METSEEEVHVPRVISQKCLNRRKRKLEQLTPEQFKSHELSGELQTCVKVKKKMYYVSSILNILNNHFIANKLFFIFAGSGFG